MSFKMISRPLLVLASIAILVLLPRVLAFAVQPCSTLYCSPEYSFGTGGDPNITSTNFKAQTGVGGLGVGNASSTNYTGDAGFVTPREEYLEMVVNATTINLGTLSTSSASTGTGTFYVRAYTSSGYFVKTITGTPANGAVSLAPMTVAAASSPGTEQFGINLVANSSPATFGVNPAPQPNSGYAYGTAATGYDTANQFKYNAGDTIATAPKGIGQTNFTIAYIANISPVSAGGSYTVDQVLVVVATY